MPFRQENKGFFENLAIESSICPQQPGLEPGWYSVYEGLQSRAYCTPFSNLSDLNNRVRAFWDSLDQQIIDKSTDHWRDKLKAVFRLNGGHIEQLFWLCVAAFLSKLCSPLDRWAHWGSICCVWCLGSRWRHGQSWWPELRWLQHQRNAGCYCYQEDPAWRGYSDGGQKVGWTACVNE